MMMIVIMTMNDDDDDDDDDGDDNDVQNAPFPFSSATQPRSMLRKLRWI